MIKYKDFKKIYFETGMTYVVPLRLDAHKITLALTDGYIVLKVNDYTILKALVEL